MATGRIDTVIRGPNAAAVAAAPRVQAQAAVPLPTIQVGVTVAAPRVAANTVIPAVGAGDPTPFGVINVVGANVLYTGHPTQPDSQVRSSTDTLDDDMAAGIGRPGRILAGPHTYSGSSWPSTFSATSVSWADDDGYEYSFLNVKTGGVSSWPSLRDGTGTFTDAFINTFIDSVPVTTKLVFTVNHEPENDGTQPSGDGGTWELANAEVWCRGIARVANLVAARNRPNVFFAVVHQTDTFPDDGVVSGANGINGRVTARWNPWQYMTAAAKGRTIFAPDGYTKLRNEFAGVLTGSTLSMVRCTSAEAADFDIGDTALCETNGGVLLFSMPFTIVSKTGSGSTRDLGVSPSFPAGLSPGNHRLRRFDDMTKKFAGPFDYVANAAWGVRWLGVFEHTVNNDPFVSDAHMAVVWGQNIKPWLRDRRDAGELSCYVGFWQSSGLESGVNGWVDTPQEVIQVAKMAWELNTGEVL